jgi:NAD(P)-dependent dehydrogenase (short-subunit alcohol dehydrogenase family)
MNQNATFHDKTVLITGGNSGIGFATAALFKKLGAQVYITGRRSDALAEAKANLGDKVTSLVADAGDRSSMKAALEHVKKERGGIDVLFLNAGLALFSPVSDQSIDVYDELMRVNVKGPYFTLQSAIPLLKPQSSVIFNTSGANVKGLPGSSAYAMTKAALRSLVRVAAAELASLNVRVNAVSPGPVQTPIFSKMDMTIEQQQQQAAYLLSLVPMKRFASASEIASVVAFLASENASYITGVEIAADGGLTQV